MNNINQSIKNVIINYLGLFITMIIGFFLTPFMIKSLGKEYYGIWILIFSFIGYFGLLELGIGSAIIKYISEYNTQNKKEEINNLISTSFYFYIVLGIFILIIGTISTYFIGNIFNIELNLLHDTKIVLLILFIDFSLNLIYTVFSASLAGIKRYDIITYLTISRSVINAIIFVIILTLGYKIISLSLTILLSDFIFNNITYAITKRYLDFDLKFHIDIPTLKKTFSYSVYTFIGAIGDKLSFYSDTFVIGIMLSTSYITVYSIALSLIEYIKKIAMRSSSVLIPVYSEYSAKNDTKKIETLFISSSKLAAILVLPLFIYLFIFGKEFIKYWISIEYVDAYTYFVILSIPYIILYTQTSGVEMLYGTANHKKRSIAFFIASIANIILSIILVKQIGLIGIAIGTMIPETIFMIYMQRLYKKTAKINMKNYYIKVWIKNILISILFIIMLLIIKKYVILSNLTQILILAMIYYIMSILVSFFFVLDKKEQNIITKYLKNK